jgi:hypothetical protein
LLKNNVAGHKEIIDLYQEEIFEETS